MQERHVTLVSGGLMYGGAEGVFTFLANRFAENGYKVTVIFAGECQNAQYQFDKRIKIYKIENRYSNKRIRQLYNNIQTFKLLLRNDKPIISFRNSEVFFYGLIDGKSMIYSLRNDIKNDSMLCRVIRKVTYKLARKIVFQTAGFLDYFTDDIRKKSVVIPNPISPELPKWDQDNHEKIIITACRLESQKNVPLLLEAFKRFQKIHCDYKLSICGVGSLEEELKQLCRSLGIEDSVQFLGYRRDIHELERKAAVFALSSDYEGLSNAMLEALAIGVPTICTDSSPGGAREYIKNGVNGLLVPVGDVDAFFHGLCALAESDALCRRLSEHARLIRNEMQPDKVFRQWEELIM